MARTEGSANKNTIAFQERYETLLQAYGDPVETLFSLANCISPAGKKIKVKHNIRVMAAVALLPYRYSKKATEIPEEGVQGELTLVWDQATGEVSDG